MTDTPSGATRVAVPDEAEESRFYCACMCGRMGYEIEGIDLIVAAELERIAADFDGAAIEYDKQAGDPERDRKLHLTGKAIGFERAARDLRLRAEQIRGNA